MAVSKLDLSQRYWTCDTRTGTRADHRSNMELQGEATADDDLEVVDFHARQSDSQTVHKHNIQVVVDVLKVTLVA